MPDDPTRLIPRRDIGGSPSPAPGMPSPPPKSTSRSWILSLLWWMVRLGGIGLGWLFLATSLAGLLAGSALQWGLAALFSLVCPLAAFFFVRKRFFPKQGRRRLKIGVFTVLFVFNMLMAVSAVALQPGLMSEAVGRQGGALTSVLAAKWGTAHLSVRGVHSAAVLALKVAAGLDRAFFGEERTKESIAWAGSNLQASLKDGVRGADDVGLPAERTDEAASEKDGRVEDAGASLPTGVGESPSRRVGADGNAKARSDGAPSAGKGEGSAEAAAARGETADRGAEEGAPVLGDRPAPREAPETGPSSSRGDVGTLAGRVEAVPFSGGVTGMNPPGALPLPVPAAGGAVSSGALPSRALVDVPLRGRGTRYLVDIVLNRRFPLRMLLDPDADYTSISQTALVFMGLDPSKKGVEFRKDEQSMLMVLADTLSIGGIELEGIAIASCDECRGEDYEGILGRNVLDNFAYTLEPATRRLRLEDRRSSHDQRIDIYPFVTIQAEPEPSGGGTLPFVITVTSRAPRDIRTLSVRLSVLDSSKREVATHRVAMPLLKAGGRVSVRVEVPRGADFGYYQVDLGSARW